MTVTDWTAIVALAFSAAALALEVRRWFESRPRLRLSVMGDALLMPGDDGKARSALFVVNRGSVPTVLNTMLVFRFKTAWHRFRRRPLMAAVVLNPGSNLPYELGTNKSWTGMLEHTDETKEARALGQLYLGVAATHSSRQFFVRVPPTRKKAATVEKGI